MTVRKLSSTTIVGSCLALIALCALSGCRPKGQTAPAQSATAAPAPTASTAPDPAATAESGEAKPEALTAALTVKESGFKTPESVYYDADADVYLVSNINGKPADKDDNGFISRLTPDGKIETLKWIDGAKADVFLSAPKGMVISEGKLYVTDIDFVRVFDAKSGKPLAKIGVPQATFLNDIAAAPDGTLYISDSGVKDGKEGFEGTGTDAVYEVGKDGQAKLLIKDASLQRPNGVCVSDGKVWVNTLGGKELYEVTGGKKGAPVELPAGGLDGLLVLPSGKLLISSWEKSTVYVGAPGKFRALIENVKGPADIGYDSKRGNLMVPLFLDDAVVIQPLPKSLTAAAATPAKPATPATPADPKAGTAATPATAAKPATPAEKAAPSEKPAAAEKTKPTPAAPAKGAAGAPVK